MTSNKILLHEIKRNSSFFCPKAFFWRHKLSPMAICRLNCHDQLVVYGRTKPTQVQIHQKLNLSCYITALLQPQSKQYVLTLPTASDSNIAYSFWFVVWNSIPFFTEGSNGINISNLLQEKCVGGRLWPDWNLDLLGMFVIWITNIFRISIQVLLQGKENSS